MSHPLPCLALCGLLALFPHQPAGPGPTGVLAHPATAPTPAFEGELVVNGEVISPIVLKRELVYRKGAAMLESRKLDILIQEEIKRQIEAGTAAAEFELSAADLEQKEQQALDQIKQQYPELEIEDVLGSNGLTLDTFGDQVKQTQLFDRVFLPDDPDAWPQTTVDVMTESGGQPMIDKLKESYQLRQEQPPAPDGEQAAPEGLAMWNTIMRKLVIQGLNKTTVVQTATDGLPPELCLVVNGVKVSTDEMYNRILGLCSAEDYRRTRQWVAKVTAVRQELERQGQLLSGEDWLAAYAEHEEPYKNSPFPMQVLAMGFKKFPSMDSYKTYYRLYASYQNLIGEELTNETLQGHMTRANQMLGLARVDCEVILCSAKNMQSGKFVEGGWIAAAEEAAEVVGKLAASAGADWNEVLEEHSDYWDPPTPQSSQVPVQQNRQKKNKGRFGPLVRNELSQRMGESDFDLFLLGSSVTDHVFFDQAVGTVDGPFRGPDGYYITRVKSRTGPQHGTLSLTDVNQRELIVQDYVACRFNQYAREIVGMASLEGM